MPAGFIRRLLEVVLKYNFFEFNGELFKQEIGTAMGAKPAPDFANVFMAKIDKLILEAAAKQKSGVFPLRMFKRFLDDIFTIFCGTVEELHQFLSDINKLHPNIKFTLEHTSTIPARFPRAGWSANRYSSLRLHCQDLTPIPGHFLHHL